MVIMSDKILVLGSNSFSGSHFVEYCLRQGMQVFGASRSPEPIKAFLPYRWLDAEQQQEFSFTQCDLNHDQEALFELIEKEKIGKVVNFAAQSMVGQSWDYPLDWYQTNVMGLVSLTQGLRQLDFLDRYVHVSTPEVYGSCSGFIEENKNYAPSTPYAVSRAAGDLHLHALHDAYGFPVVFTRAANVFGPGQQLYRIIPKVIISLLTGRKIPLHGGGTSQRSFIHMQDVADATFKILNAGVDGEIYHISTDYIVSIRELVDMICMKMEKTFEDNVDIVGDRVGKDAAYILSSENVKKLGWGSRIGLPLGLEKVRAWIDQYQGLLCQLDTSYRHKR
jgi:dTDP-glucose 4,6-dehydratase